MRYRLKTQSGMAFVWILVLLAMVSAVGLSFLQKAATGTAAAVSRGSAMKAHYLARAGANHALWRMLNDPAFSPSEEVYDMHDLGDGRYGYKVRKPTLTTLGTVATVGGVGETITRHSYVQYLKPYDIITAYDQLNAGIPRYRRLVAAYWGDPADTLDDGPDEAQWIVLKGCPKRKEVLMGTLDDAGHYNLAVWNGTGWGNVKEFTTAIGTAQYRCFDIAYENVTGNALIVGRYDAGTGVRFIRWTGAQWLPVNPLAAAELTPQDPVTHLTMAAKPGSDEILIAEVQNTKDLKLVRWNGNQFFDHGEIETGLMTDAAGSAVIVYEQQSGDALILWNRQDETRMYYSIWNGSVLSAPAQAPDFGGVIYYIGAAADPNSDHIFAAAVDGNFHLNVAVWDGNAWSGPHEVETAVSDRENKTFDIAWEHAGDEVLIAWRSDAGGGARIRYFSWQKGTGLASRAVQSGPDFQNTISRVRLLAIRGLQKIVLLASTGTDQLRYSLWNGGAFLADPAVVIESSLYAGKLSFDMAGYVAP